MKNVEAVEIKRQARMNACRRTLRPTETSTTKNELRCLGNRKKRKATKRK